LVSDNGTSTYWSNDGTSVDGSEPQSSISVSVNGGLYSVLLGNTANQGMGSIDPQVFAQHSDAKLRVWFSDGVNEFQQLTPDRPFASVPYAFSAGNAETAGSGPIANGAVTKSMLSSEVINDINRKITMDDLDPIVIVDLNDSVADGSITINQLSEQILKYLKPEITQQPTAGTIFADTNGTISVSAEGKYLTYQWKKNGVNLVGENNATLTITDANSTLHDGNYSVVVSNDFGSVDSEELEVAIADFSLLSYSGLMLWLDASNLMTADTLWIDKSGNGNHALKHNTPTVQTNAQNGLSLMRYDKVLPASDTDYHEWNDISDIRTLFAVFKRDNGNDGAVVTDDNLYHFYSDGSPLLSSTYANHNIKNGLYRLNGTSVTAISTSYPASLSIVAIRTLGNVEASRIGRDRSVDYGHFDGDFAELIIFNTALSDDYISEVEGYLAHKWGLTALLPSNHTYKNSVP
jgi:hypothetical protein